MKRHYKTSLWIVFLLIPFMSFASERMVWQQGQDYIAIKKRPAMNSEAASNILSQCTVTKLLTALEYEAEIDIPELLGTQSESANVFSDKVAKKLSAILYKELRQLSAGEVITFSVSEVAPRFLGIGNKPVTTSGSVFYADNRIHLIIGELRVDLKKRFIKAGYAVQNGRYPTSAEMKNFRLDTGNVESTSEKTWKLILPGDDFQQLRFDWVAVPEQIMPT